jgi:predicted RecB family nuclease
MTERLLTPSKITAFLDCAHYLTLQHQVEAGRPVARTGFGSMARMLMDKGMAHEQACLADYRSRGKTVFEVPARAQSESFADWVARVGNPLADGHDVVYQMPFVHGGVRGIADFVERVHDDTTGEVRYEPVDAKLARQAAKPGHVLQLCFYADAIEALTGVSPRDVRIWLGSGRIDTVRLADVHAYWRRLRLQLTSVMDADSSTAVTTPEKCGHCEFCEFAGACETQWRSEDSLVFVANILRSDRAALVESGHPTMVSLASCHDSVAGVRPERQVRLVEQAALQVQARESGEPVPPISLLPVSTESPMAGFLALPLPDDGDVFLDYEGHPFWQPDTGLFFLFGLITRRTNGEWVYDARWAHDRIGEGQITKKLIDDLVERRHAHPGMHVYHYNHTERSSLLRLATEHGVGEAALDGLVETGLFVDLLTVVTNSMQVGVESYGLKHIERLTGYERGHDIDQGAGAVVEYDAYCGDHDEARLERIARYNEDDVRATLALRDWLITQRPADLPWRVAVIEPPESNYPDIDAQVEALHAFPVDSAEHLLGDLLGYWLREGRAVFGGMVAKTAYDLSSQLDDAGMLAGLRFIGLVDRVDKNGNSLKKGAEFSFPEQAIGRKLSKSPGVVFSAGDELLGFSSIDELDLEAGIVRLVWNERCQELGITPSAVVLNDWVAPKPKPQALSALAAQVVAADADDPASPVAVAILRRDRPRFRSGGGPADGLLTDTLVDLQRWVLELDHSYLAIQGPPGTGKTYTGAHLIHALVMQNKRVGITAMSHHAIDNLLKKVVEVFTDAGDLDRLCAVRKVSGEQSNPIDGVDYVTDNAACRKAKYNVVGGTTWLFARDDMRLDPVDVLVIDEAGQLSLADALAAHNVVLLGDPLQLAHVSQGTHPGGSGASVLQHLLGEYATIPPDRGVFLSETWRMHPDVCGFTSEQVYEGRLTSHSSCAVQNTGAGTGLRWIRAVHEGCSTESPDEVVLIVGAIEGLLGQSWTDAQGTTRPLTVHDFKVVAPYNDQVALLQAGLAANPATAGVLVGTVDKFQGEEARWCSSRWPRRPRPMCRGGSSSCSPRTGSTWRSAEPVRWRSSCAPRNCSTAEREPSRRCSSSPHSAPSSSAARCLQGRSWRLPQVALAPRSPM